MPRLVHSGGTISFVRRHTRHTVQSEEGIPYQAVTNFLLVGMPSMDCMVCLVFQDMSVIGGYPLTVYSCVPPTQEVHVLVEEYPRGLYDVGPSISDYSHVFVRWYVLLVEEYHHVFVRWYVLLVEEYPHVFVRGYVLLVEEYHHVFVRWYVLLVEEYPHVFVRWYVLLVEEYHHVFVRWYVLLVEEYPHGVCTVVCPSG